MSWERDPLWVKSRLFFERAFEESRDDPKFGLWCSLGIELLGRAALASISPTLLAKPHEKHLYLLHALNRGKERVPRLSIGAKNVFDLCYELFEQFTEDDRNAALALVHHRNYELHTGAASFAGYSTQQWLASFYRACESLCEILGESLENLFGEEVAVIAAEILD